MSLVFISRMLCIYFLMSLHALYAKDTVNISVTGNLVKPPCTYTDSKTIDVNMGSVTYDKYETATGRIPLVLTCPPQSAVQVTVRPGSGTTLANGSTTTAVTSYQNLGIELWWSGAQALAGGQQQLVSLTGNKKFTDLSGQVDLSMTPKLKKLAELGVSTFSASFTVELSYD
ncbi:fimbrial protein [Pantoea sp. C2G6]|uniref:fimbrial protein n=1 Tax=Pantoea sp. C2G6 TaxID=3243084 RepID=UPI003ED9ABB4